MHSFVWSSIPSEIDTSLKRQIERRVDRYLLNSPYGLYCARYIFVKSVSVDFRGRFRVHFMVTVGELTVDMKAIV